MSITNTELYLLADKNKKSPGKARVSLCPVTVVIRLKIKEKNVDKVS